MPVTRKRRSRRWWNSTDDRGVGTAALLSIGLAVATITVLMPTLSRTTTDVVLAFNANDAQIDRTVTVRTATRRVQQALTNAWSFPYCGTDDSAHGEMLAYALTPTLEDPADPTSDPIDPCSDGVSANHSTPWWDTHGATPTYPASVADVQPPATGAAQLCWPITDITGPAAACWSWTPALRPQHTNAPDHPWHLARLIETVHPVADVPQLPYRPVFDSTSRSSQVLLECLVHAPAGGTVTTVGATEPLLLSTTPQLQPASWSGWLRQPVQSVSFRLWTPQSFNIDRTPGLLFCPVLEPADGETVHFVPADPDNQSQQGGFTSAATPPDGATFQVEPLDLTVAVPQ